MIDLRFMGAVEVSSGAERIALQPKRTALLAYLVMGRPQGFHRREILASLLWPETADRRARNALSQALHGLRKALGPEKLVTPNRDEVGVDVDAVRCDATRLEDDLDAGRLEDALGRYEGSLLEGLHVSGAIGFERWLDGERSRLRRRTGDAARALADRAEAQGNLVSAARWLERGLEIVPSNELDARRMMALLDQLGDRGGALRAYEDLARHLDTQFDAEPAPETTELVERIRTRSEVSGAFAPTSSPKPDGQRRIAVLPLQNLTGDPSQEYFADGMTETLIGALARSTDVPVISRQSVVGFKDSRLSLGEIARRLGADLVLEGAVLRGGDHVRISTQLLQVDPEEHLWADAFDGNLDELVALHDQVAWAVAKQVGGHASSALPAKKGSARAVGFAAYDEFLKGVVAFPYITPDTFHATLANFERATELDPGFAEAHAWIAFLWCNAAYVGLASFDEARTRAIPAVERALDIEPELGALHAIHATVLLSFIGDWSAVDDAFGRAERLGGGDSRSWGAHGLFLTGMGRFDEALTVAEKHIRLDPVGAPFNYLRGWILFRARRYGEALEQLEWVRRTWPAYVWTSAFLAACELFAGWPARAVDTCREAVAASPRVPTVLAYVAATLGRAGEPEEAKPVIEGLETMRRQTYVDPFPMAVARAGLGEHGRALDELERVLRQGSTQSWSVMIEAFFDPLKHEPRFEAVRRELGLPDL